MDGGIRRSRRRRLHRPHRPHRRRAHRGRCRQDHAGDVKWFDQTWFLVVSLLFCFPVGLFLVWRKPWTTGTQGRGDRGHRRVGHRGRGERCYEVVRLNVDQVVDEGPGDDIDDHHNAVAGGPCEGGRAARRARSRRSSLTNKRPPRAPPQPEHAPQPRRRPRLGLRPSGKRQLKGPPRPRQPWTRLRQRLTRGRTRPSSLQEVRLRHCERPTIHRPRRCPGME